MSSVGAAHDAVIAKFRERQRKASQVKSDAEKQREARLAKQRQSRAAPGKPGRKRKVSGADAQSSEPSTSASAVPSRAGSTWHASPPVKTRPLGLRQKMVVDFLRRHNEPQSAADVAAGTGIDLEDDEDLVRLLSGNDKVGWDEDGRLFYRSDIDVKSRPALLEKIRRADPPVSVRDVADAYVTALQDVEALKAEGLILGLHCSEPDVACDILFPVDQNLRAMTVDPDIVELWHEVKLPETQEEIAAQLQRIGLVPAPHKAVHRREKGERKRKARRQTKLRAVTNVHMMHLLEGEAPNTIE